MDRPQLCSGYPSVFREFVEYARGLGFTEKPNYRMRRELFRAVIPGLPRDILYDLNDMIGPRMGAGVRADRKYRPPYKPGDIKLEPSYGAEDSHDLPRSDDRFLSLNTWPLPSQVKDADQLGDEDDCVLGTLE